MKPDGFFNAARALHVADEGCQRSAVSRVYYGAHHSVVESYKLTPPRKGRHWDVLCQLLGIHDYSASPPLNKQAGKLLQKMLERRNIADYDIHLPWGSEAEAEAWASWERLRKMLP